MASKIETNTSDIAFKLISVKKLILGIDLYPDAWVCCSCNVFYSGLFNFLQLYFYVVCCATIEGIGNSEVIQFSGGLATLKLARCYYSQLLGGPRR